MIWPRRLVSPRSSLREFASSAYPFLCKPYNGSCIENRKKLTVSCKCCDASHTTQPSLKAAILKTVKQPLQIEETAKPQLAAGHVLLRVRACGVCRTDLHIVEGE
ncbi:MAG: alcohol dehydrogenase catalytic domain-containing protein, partial [Candidatus Sulfotelmatobacter sp.]